MLPNRVLKDNDEYYNVIRNMFDPSNKLNDQQIQVFLHVAKERNLNPLLKQICLIPKTNSMTGRTEGVIVTQIDGLRLIAEKSGKYSPGKDTEYLYDDKNNLLGAKAYVKKLTKDGTWHEISATAFIKEYSTKKSIWLSMPHVMIEKCAEARALRRAFPSDLSGLYSEEEMDQAMDQGFNPTLEVEKKEDLFINEEKVKSIELLLDGNDDIKKRLLNYCKVTSIENIRDSQYDTCYKTVNRIIENQRKITQQFLEEENEIH